MAAVDLGEICIDDIVAGRIEINQNTKNDVPDNKDFDDDASCFTTATDNSVNATDIYGNNCMGPGDERETNSTNRHHENGANPQNLHPPTPEIAMPGDLIQINNSSSPNDANEENNHQTASDVNVSPIPKGRSLAHFKSGAVHRPH